MKSSEKPAIQTVSLNSIRLPEN